MKQLSREYNSTKQQGGNGSKEDYLLSEPIFATTSYEDPYFSETPLIEEHELDFRSILFLKKGLSYIQYKYRNLVCVVNPVIAFEGEPKAVLWQSGLNWITKLTKKRYEFDTVKASPWFEELFDKCIKDDLRFVVVVVGLFHQSKRQNFGHANLVLIDKEQLTIERYDPQGNQTSSMFLPEKLDSFLEHYFVEKLSKISKGWKYISRQDLKLRSGIQNIQERLCVYEGSTGFCQSWILFFLDMRMKYPNIDSVDLEDSVITKFRQKDLTSFIRNYVSFLQNL